MLKKIHWTQHAKSKMRQYRLSKSRLLRVFEHPSRVEKGVAPGTTAIMQPTSNPVKTSPFMKCGKVNNKTAKFKKWGFYNVRKKNVGEIWLMYQDTQKMRKIITAWRYPGKSPIGEEIPIPEDIKLELTKQNVF